MSGILLASLFDVCPGCERRDTWRTVAAECACGWTSKDHRRKLHIRDGYAQGQARRAREELGPE